MQLSLFDNHFALPANHDDIFAMWSDYINPGTQDSDAFTWEEIKDGRSYYFYGTMVFHLVADSNGHFVFKLSGKVYRQLTFSCGNITDSSMHPIRNLSYNQWQEVLRVLQSYHRQCFRSIIIDRFGCCNDHVRCSDAKSCIHADDRYYNGCQYRENLEAGRIFYGKNRNV